MIQIPEAEERFKAGGAEAIRDRRVQLIIEALRSAVSVEEIRTLKLNYTADINRLLSLMAKSDKDLEERIKRLELAEDALNKRLKELEKPKSSLEINKPKVNNPSLLEDIINAIKNHK